MMLQIDVGNTQTKWRLMDGENLSARGCQITSSLLAKSLDLTTVSSVTEARLCSVASPEITRGIKQQLADQYDIGLQIAQVSAHAGGVTCGYEPIKALGVDRWLALVAAFKCYRRAVLVVDAGSAMTLDLVSPEGAHVGGYILPGLRLMRDALWRGTQKVRPEQQRESFAAIETVNMVVPGAGTEDAVNRGCLLAAVSAVEKIASTYPATVVITGGDGATLADALSLKTEYKPDLVFDGLAVEDIALVSG
jgi:type III pantothenate kinase